MQPSKISRTGAAQPPAQARSPSRPTCLIPNFSQLDNQLANELAACQLPSREATPNSEFGAFPVLPASNSGLPAQLGCLPHALAVLLSSSPFRACVRASVRACVSAFRPTCPPT
eukprot:4766026-Pleurochrysis_carterae.AAC.1